MRSLKALKESIQQVYMGSPDAVDRLIVCLLARGHALIEAVPGVGKTILASALARSLDCVMSRIQLTPDLLPSDILGVTVWDQHKGEFVFKPGPVFANVVLADEINRTTPRTQSALLEAMNEAQVTVDGQTRKLDQPFMVIATQNPHEFEGTYVLPENQVDRFLMRIRLDYPPHDDEARIIRTDPFRTALSQVTPVLTADELVALQEKVHNVAMDQSLVDYILRIAEATRRHDQIRVGISTRGALMLSTAALATALVKDREYVVPDDIIDNVFSVCSHRVITESFGHEGQGVAAEQVLEEILRELPVPT